MNVKLTLKLDKNIIEKARHYAKTRNQSLSSLVQNYFNFISENRETEQMPISQNIRDISGIVQLDENMNVKDEYRKHILKKYS